MRRRLPQHRLHAALTSATRRRPRRRCRTRRRRARSACASSGTNRGGGGLRIPERIGGGELSRVEVERALADHHLDRVSVLARLGSDAQAHAVPRPSGRPARRALCRRRSERRGSRHGTDIPGSRAWPQRAAPAGSRLAFIGADLSIRRAPIPPRQLPLHTPAGQLCRSPRVSIDRVNKGLPATTFCHSYGASVYIVHDELFQWSDAKARANLKKHSVTFEAARLVFDDAASVDEDRRPRGLRRGSFHHHRAWPGGRSTVTYTEREGRIRIISARKATRREQDDYFRQDF